MTEITVTPLRDRAFDNFERSYAEFLEASDLTKPDKAARLASQIDILSLTRDGLSFLYEKCVELDRSGFFINTAWNEPEKLVPILVRGTLKYGHPGSSFEILSDLRMLAYAKGKWSTEKISKEDAQNYLEEVIVHNLDFALRETSEDTRETMSERELKKSFNLFGFLVSEIDLSGITEKLAEEVSQICEQRPVVTQKARELIHLVEKKFDLRDSIPAEKKLQLYVGALYRPSPGTLKNPTLDEYSNFLDRANLKILEEEARAMGKSMGSTGLVSQYHALLLVKLLHEEEQLIPECLDLNDRGIAEWNKHNDFLKQVTLETISVYNAQFIYGLARMLGRSLFSRRPVRVGLENLRRIKINPQVESRILKSNPESRGDVTAIQYLMGALIRVLGQPLGVGQGNNPTCQSARGISMWSHHAPAKLIDMIITVATQNNLVMRFENNDLISNQLGKGLVDKLDHNLDGVSIVLVPHLDKIYNEMMLRATGRGEDPHKWVNPAMYGQWIQIGFASVYDYLTNSIMDFKGFIRIFYASFHPDFNNERQLSYPNPVGIFITSSKAEMVGFHAISLLRVDKGPKGDVRAYFLNPNNEGRQDWGQDIKPTVHGNGEKHGESSLPFDQFAARVYAFHYNTLDVKSGLSVSQKEIEKVESLAKESWGKSYVWSQQTKLW